jgi:hypothetical protein
LRPSDYQTGRLNDFSTSIVGVGQNQIGIDAQASTFLVCTGGVDGTSALRFIPATTESAAVPFHGEVPRRASWPRMQRGTVETLRHNTSSPNDDDVSPSAGVARVVCSMGVVEPMTCQAPAPESDGGRFKIDLTRLAAALFGCPVKRGFYLDSQQV